jgi:hypothetical protein
MKPIKFNSEPVDKNLRKLREFFNEADPLFIEHKNEIAEFQDIDLNYDYETYEEIARKKNLKLFTARKESNGDLIGYALFFINYNIHYSKSLQAFQDVIFIKKSERGFGSSFIKFIDECLLKDGVEVVYHHVKAKHDFSSILKRQGYHLVDYVYGKRL